VFLVSWNEFAVALILTRSDRSYTIPVVLSMFSQTLQLTPFDLMIAAGVVGALVPAILVMFFQRHIISGLTMGSTR
jgi:multiple sugar transport system permease protein